MVKPEPLSPTGFTSLLKDDMAGISVALENGSVDRVRIFANRFAADAALFRDSRGADTALFIGACLRTFADDYLLSRQQLKASGHSQTLLEDLCLTYLGDVSETIPQLESGFQGAVAAFIRFEREIPKFQRWEEESESATPDLQLGGAPRRALTSFLQRETQLPFDERSRIPEGALNEFTRFYRVYEFEEKDLCFYLGVRGLFFLQTYYRNLIYHAFDSENDAAVGRWRAEATEWNGKFRGWLAELDAQSDSEAWESTRGFVADYMARWRELFNIYLEPTEGEVGNPAEPTEEKAGKSNTTPRKRVGKSAR
jgi:hypothetical protein